MSEFFGILEFGLHFGKAHIEINFLEFSLGKVEFKKASCEDWDVDLSQRIFKKGIWVTYSMRQLARVLHFYPITSLIG